MQLRDLGQQPAASVQPRDYRAANVAAVSAQQPTAASTGSSNASQTSSPTSMQHQQQSQAVSRAGVADSNGQHVEAPVAQPDAQQQLQQLDAHNLEALPGLDTVLKSELQQLRDSYLVLQDAYWGQKERLLALEIEAGQLRVQCEQAQASAAQV